MICFSTFPGPAATYLRPAATYLHELVHASIDRLVENSKENLHCTECDFTCNTTAEIDNHKLTTHSYTSGIIHHNTTTQAQDSGTPKNHLRESVIICGSCAKGFQDVNSFNFHHKEHTGHTSIRCIACAKCFPTVIDFEKHMETEHVSPTRRKIKVHNIEQNTDTITVLGNETCYKCSYCEYLGNTDEISRHITIKHKKREICKECGNNFPDLQTLQNHIYYSHSLY